MGKKPITCNSMGKAVAGIGDNLLSSVFVAWEYQKKRMIFCPACNVDMWNNSPTQRNVAYLKEMGVEFLGPRVDRLTNGQVAIGCMEKVSKIVDALQEEEEELMSGTTWFWRRAKSAAATKNDVQWELVLRAVEEKLFDVNEVEAEHGNTILHLAAGGEPMVDQGGKYESNIRVMKRLVELGADVNLRNKFGISALHASIGAQDMDAISILLEAGADSQGVCIDFPDVSSELRDLLSTQPKATELATKYYFTYGSLKRGFPNHENEADHLKKFIGKATTIEPYPLVVPFEKSCSNPNCPYLHQQASLVDQQGVGKRVEGEVFEVCSEDVVAFDRLEGFHGLIGNENVYSRRIIDVDVEGKGTVSAYVYFTTSQDPMNEVASGNAEFVSKYLIDMAKGELKPAFSSQSQRSKQRASNLTFLKVARKTMMTDGNLATQMMSAALEEEEDDDGNDDDDGVEEEAAAAKEVTVSEDRRVNLRLTKTPVGHYNSTLKVNIGSVQQTINTCNLASVTLALSGLNIDCSVDDIFTALHLPTQWVVENGLTLAQVFNVLVKLSSSTFENEQLVPDVFVECYHFDEAVANLESFREFLKLSTDKKDNVLIVNFHSGIARNMDGGGGGHFSVVSGYDDTAKMVSIADVHPKKYNAHWATSDKLLFEAMVDKDSSSKRARGLICVKLMTARPNQNLEACRRSISFCDAMFNSKESAHLSRWGDLPVPAFGSHINMGGLQALALALSGFLSEEDYRSLALPNYITSDFLAWTLSLKITDLLSSTISPQTLTKYARSSCKKLGLNLSARTVEADVDVDSFSEFFANRVGSTAGGVAMVLIDINEALGFEVVEVDETSEAAALAHGSSHWCCVVSVSADTAIIADTCAKRHGRLWRCSMQRLRDGMLASSGNKNIVLLEAVGGIGVNLQASTAVGGNAGKASITSGKVGKNKGKWLKKRLAKMGSSI